MEVFKYSLDHGSKKFPCPKCGKKRLVKFLDSESGEYLSDNYGRCDRESECGYHKAPQLGTKGYQVQFLLIQSISNKAYKLTDLDYRIHFVPKSQVLEVEERRAWISEFYLANNELKGTGEVRYFDNGSGAVLNVVTSSSRIEIEPSFHSLDLLEISEPDNLSEYLRSQYDTEKVETVKDLYLLSGTNKPWSNSTVYWQIDLEGKIRGGKIMHYDNYGKRTKKPRPRISWMHKTLNLESFQLSQCLYGLHLAKQNPDKVIYLLESEKSCLIMTLRNPQILWLATGSKSGLKPSMLEPIKDRLIIAYPDKSCYNDWRLKAEAMNREGFKIEVSDVMEKSDLPDGSDLADI